MGTLEVFKMLFADDTYVVDTFESYGVDVDLRGPAKLLKGSALSHLEIRYTIKHKKV